MSTLVVAFGGNAIARANEQGTYEEQLRNVESMCAALAKLVTNGHNVLVTHGNGPQVGAIALQQDMASDKIPPMPFDAAGAMSQGLIGYMLQQGMTNTLRARGTDCTCVSVVTRVVVSADDPAFENPTKPVGRFYSLDEANELRTAKGWTMVEDAGRGYRRVVPSPRPLHIVEWPAVAALVSAGCIVIAAGGGGIPVVEAGAERTSYRGVEAVIDKDRAAQKLASLVGADTLVLLTDVPRVAVDYGTPSERWLDTVSAEDLRDLNDAGEFPAGSMGPKVESALAFVDGGGPRAIITNAHNLIDAVEGSAGTQIVAAYPRDREKATAAAPGAGRECRG